ncbi:PAS domain S-box protein [uncultured Neptuniibacter sp.]|uniref:hybrid sensor histidine kinase/response regulator n=1 Tax=uncultured Neptuniibacter sp. TaxID=502143 RepID=UPI00262891CA|nr:PAS domain S-box protein [uncultured Neptuniibacter sp.]
MSMHRLLLRQLKLTGFEPIVTDPLDVDFKSLVDSLMQQPEFESCFAQLLHKVNESYILSDRNSNLLHSSMRISHEELELANDNLRADAELQTQLIGTLQSNIRALMSSSGRTYDHEELNVEQLPQLFRELLKENETAKRQLQFQKDALDAHAIVSITDKNGSITYANDKFCKISGYSEAELIGNTHSMVKSGEHSESFYKELWSTISSGNVWHGELKNSKRDGGYYWVAATIKPILGVDGKPEQYISIRTDITYRKEMENSIHLEKQFLDGLANTIGEGVFALDVDGRCTFLNDEAERILGWQREEFIGQIAHNLIHYKSSAGDQLPFDQCPIMLRNLQGQSFHSDDECFIHKDGHNIPVEVTSVPLLQGEKHLGSVSVFKDISLRKEEELNRLLALKKAEAATQAKSEFLANMSHEIRTPMNAIIGLSHLALTGQLDKQQYNNINKIHDSAKNLLTIINDILDFSKIEAGQLNIENTEFELDKLLLDLYDLNYIKADEKEIEFSVKRDFSLANNLIGDPIRISQILTNLTSNAIKFTEQGSVQVDLFPVRCDGSSLLLRVQVIDTGVGIEKEKQSILFDSFTQADASTTRKYGGTGLGLSITHKLTELIGGTISLKSEFGKGTTVTVDLPVEVNTHAEARDVSFFEGLNILLVGGRPSLQKQLESLQMSYQRSPFGEVALASKCNRKPDCIVVVDRADNESDLFNFLKSEIDNQPAFNQLPVVVATTIHRAKFIQRHQYSFRLFIISELYTPSCLFNTIQDALQGSDDNNKPLHNSFGVDIQHSLSGVRVLLAEDNQINTEVALGMLNKMGVETVAVDNGKQALEALENQAFDIVLMDLQMPEMDGYTAAKIIRSQRCYDDLPVIALTAHAMEEDKQKSLELGMDDHLTKPIDPLTLFKTLRRWVDRNQLINLDQTPSLPQRLIDVGLPPVLPGLDYSSGLKRTSYDPVFYAGLWNKFQADFSNIADQLSELVRRGELDKVHNFAHALKGVCTNLGATSFTELAEAIGALNTLADDKPAQLVERAKQEQAILNCSLDKLRTAIDVIKPDSSEPKAGNVIGKLLEELLPLVEVGDTKALSMADDLHQYAFEDPLLQDQFVATLKAITNFDFEKAKGLIIALQEGLKL